MLCDIFNNLASFQVVIWPNFNRAFGDFLFGHLAKFYHGVWRFSIERLSVRERQAEGKKITEFYLGDRKTSSTLGPRVEKTKREMS